MTDPEVCEDGLLLGNKWLIRWNDINYMKFFTETRVDLKVEGKPVTGYGMYGYASTRFIVKQACRRVDVAIP